MLCLSGLRATGFHGCLAVRASAQGNQGDGAIMSKRLDECECLISALEADEDSRQGASPVASKLEGEPVRNFVCEA